MIDRTTFAGNVGIIGTGRSLYVASVFIFTIGLARSLGPESFGSFQQVFMLNILFMILSLGIPDTLFFFLPRLSAEKQSAFLGQTAALLGILGIGTAAVLWLGAPFFASLQKNPAIAPHIKPFGIYGASVVFSSFFDPVFILYRKVRYLFFLSLFHALFFVGLTLWQCVMNTPLVLLFNSMALFGMVKVTLGFALFLSLRERTGVIPFRFDSGSILLQMSFALPIGLSNAIDIVSRWLDKFVISAFLGAGALGIFYVGAIEIPFVSVFIASVYNVISPKLNTLHYENDYEGFRSLVAGTVKVAAAFIWPLCVYFFVFADHLLPLVFTDSYTGAVPIFRIYLLLMPIRIFLFGVIIVALGKPAIVFWAALGSTLLNFVLNIIFVRIIGFSGPAIATVVSTYLQVAFLTWSIMVNLKTTIRRLIPFKKLLLTGFICAIAGIVAYFPTMMYRNNLTVVLISLTLFAAAYIFLGVKTDLFNLPKIMNIGESGLYGKEN